MSANISLAKYSLIKKYVQIPQNIISAYVILTYLDAPIFLIILNFKIENIDKAIQTQQITMAI